MRRARHHGGYRLAIAGAVTTCLAVSGAGLIVAAFQTTTAPPSPASVMPTERAASERAASKQVVRHDRPRGSLVRRSVKEKKVHGARKSPRPSSDHFGPSLPQSRPVAVHIPAIGVNAKRVVPLGMTDAGALAAPRKFDTPGWYRRGPTPGETGRAVITGHVDSPEGPAVFWNLGALDRGLVVRVTRADDTVARFRIDAVRSYPTSQFPTDKVYGSSRRAELRLITCGGTYDSDTGYTHNVVVFAHLIDSRPRNDS